MDSFSLGSLYSHAEGATEILSSVQSRVELFLTPIFHRLPPVLDAPSQHLASLLASAPKQHSDIDTSDPALAKAIIVILLAPLLWNIIARFEYKTKLISRITGKYIGCYALALWIFSFSLYRDKVFLDAMNSQTTTPALANDEYIAFAGLMFVTGSILVISSYIRLGIAGTYLGDYFGILFDEKLEGFPFNVSEHPMYDGSSMLFLAKAIMSQSMAGVLLAGWVYIVYRVASLYEGDFTNTIYAEANNQKQKQVGKAATASSTKSTTSTPKVKASKSSTSTKQSSPVTRSATKASKTMSSTSSTTKRK